MVEVEVVPYFAILVPILLTLLGGMVLILALGNVSAERTIADIERRIDRAETIRARANAELKAPDGKRKARSTSVSRPVDGLDERELL